MNGNRGFTIVELIFVMAIMAILLSIAGVQFNQWMERYGTESEIKELYSDLMNARAMAMTNNRLVFVTFDAANQYTIREDTSPAPDGSGTVEGADRLVQLKTNLDYNLTVALSFGATQFYFNGKGHPSLTGNMRIASALPEYNCVNLAATRINIGKWDGVNCVAR